MEPRYDHHQHEQKIYQLWEKVGAFSPDYQASPDKNSATPNSTSRNKPAIKKPFTIMMPPPNANAPLHIGHALFVTLEDVLTRYHRMLGDDTLWLPGTDHAGIETQFVFEKELKKEGKSRFDFDRNSLYQMIWDHVQENSDVAVNQMKKLGASADWDRFVFMLDPDNVEVVLETFFKLHEQKLVYRDQQLVNYCTHCGTAFSNLEVEYQERKIPFYHIKYGPFTIGTVRPETKFRDTALAVHPDDKRYQKHLGKTFEIMGLLGKTKMTIIPDEGVDPEFGTGIMKVTPAHDPHDFELGKKHNLPVTPIINLEGRMDFAWFLDNPDNNPDHSGNADLPSKELSLKQKYWQRAQKYHGLKVVNIRKEMKQDFEEDGLLEDYDPNYQTRIAVCYRCGNPIEPLPLPQFFIKVKPLVEPILKALNNKEFKVHGPGYTKILRHWLETLHDWNISRQIVWGIRLPVWYDTSLEENRQIQVSFIDKKHNKITDTLENLLSGGGDSDKYTLSKISQGLQGLTAPLEAKFVISKDSPGQNFIQETDTFDTWFSSSQWPFSTLQALDKKNSQAGNKANAATISDFQRFYPTQVMETAYDILTFWVMRMLFMGKFATGELPFTDIYLHGLVRDQKGQKMSKSKGNVINPLEVVDEFGADALRMALVIRSSAAGDKSVGRPDFKAMRNLSNKIWNAARFVLEHSNQQATTKLKKTPSTSDKAADPVFMGEQAFEQKLAAVVAAVTKQLDDLKPGMAAETVYNQFWHWFCDECIEANKAGTLSHKSLMHGLKTFLALLHPFMPFVTEVIWQELHQQQPDNFPEKMLITASWPSKN